ncbi:MAG: PilZ domain-containing protein [Bdellovibrionaceae bacterium]|nr:PilZ domain-containing protein [Pseudobdellovibrionaceae bacterium]
MKNKPIPLKLLAILHLLTPFFSLLFNSLIMGMSPWLYTQAHWQSHSMMELLEFYTFFPLAGLMILSFSSWGYVVYFAVVLWTSTLNTMVWFYEYSRSPWILLSANLFIIVSVLYMLSPKVRRIYMDQNLRWWKTPRRYAVNINEVVLNNDVRTDVNILNISQGGALVQTTWQPHLGESLSLCFTLGDFDFSTDAKVVHQKEGYFGVQFLTNTDILTDAIKFTDLDPIYQEPKFTEQMRCWVNDLKQGRGLFPEV